LIPLPQKKKTTKKIQNHKTITKKSITSPTTLPATAHFRGLPVLSFLADALYSR
jgi:hypothetical protein